jgi:hypothetical protein
LRTLTETNTVRQRNSAGGLSGYTDTATDSAAAGTSQELVAKKKKKKKKKKKDTKKKDTKNKRAGGSGGGEAKVRKEARKFVSILLA